MNRNEFKKAKKEDLARYHSSSFLKKYLFSTDYRIVYQYRKCKYLEGKKWLFLLYQLARLRFNHLCVKFGCDIPSHVCIGSGLRIDHANGIVINSKAVIGKNATIKGGVVIGANDNGVPIIGDNVLLGIHSIVIGNVIVGDNAIIGAGAIVVHDVPSNAIVINPVASILHKKGGDI